MAIETAAIETAPIETAAIETAAIETAAIETAAIKEPLPIIGESESQPMKVDIPPLSFQLPPANVTVKPIMPVVPEFIMGKGLISQDAMSAFLLAANPGAEKEFVEELAFIYIEEATAEGVNHDTAFAQMCLETGFLSFTGLVSPEQNNFCGLGAIGPGQPGEIFPDPRTGVRAHIQHLKAYATDTPLKQKLVDPRYYFVRFGSSPEIKGLSGTWAADLLYADKIGKILERLYNFAYGI